MTGDHNQFSLWMPGFFRSALNLILYTDGQEQNRWRITDPNTGKSFSLTDDEMHMMEVLSENLFELHEKLAPSFLGRLRHPWDKDRHFNVRDLVLDAIVKRRFGNTVEWDRLPGMTTDQWHEWLENVLGLNSK